MWRTGRLTTTAMLAAALLSQPGVAAADPPPDPPGPVERYDDITAVFPVFLDAEAGLLALAGPPAEERCYGEGFTDGSDVQVLTREPRQGKVTGDIRIWVYEIPEAGTICDVLYAGGTPELLASGTARFVLTVNYDGQEEWPRTTAFALTATGTLGTPGGETCQFLGTSHAVEDEDGDLQTLTERVALRC
jgi:hypothetical protein